MQGVNGGNHDGGDKQRRNEGANEVKNQPD